MTASPGLPAPVQEKCRDLRTAAELAIPVPQQVDLYRLLISLKIFRFLVQQSMLHGKLSVYRDKLLEPV